MPTRTIRDELIQTALEFAQALADRRCRSPLERERALDAATDAILRAIEQHPDSPDFPAIAASYVELAIHSVATKPRLKDRAEQLSALPHLDPSACCTVQHSHDPFATLPEDLRVPCVLYCVHGYTLLEVGLLTGAGVSTVRDRLRRAYHLLPDLQTHAQGDVPH